jgi:hypothetical protein
MTVPAETTYVENAQIEVPFGSLIDEALSYLYRGEERPLPVQMGTDDLPLAGDTEFSVDETSSPEVNRTDLLEYGQELILVTKKNAGAPESTFTGIRGYGGTPNEGPILNGEFLVKGPRWKRFHMARAIVRGLSGTIARHLPMTVDSVLSTHGDGWVALPEDTLDVIRVGIDSMAGPHWFDDWLYERDFSPSPTLQAVRLPGAALDMVADTLYVQRKIPYQYFDPATFTLLPRPPWGQEGEEFLVRLWAGTEDLVALYAAAFIVMGREVSRVELESMEQWNTETATRYQVNLRLVQMLWTQFYQRFDESRPQHRFRTARPFRRRRAISAGWSP